MVSGEIYKLSLLLEAENRASGAIGGLVGDLVKLRNESKQTQSSYSNLLKTLNRPIADKSGSKLLQTLTSIQRESKQTGSQIGWLKNKADNLGQSAGGANKLASAISNVENRAGKALSTVDRLANNSRNLGDGLPSSSRNRRRGKSELDNVFEEEENYRRRKIVPVAADLRIRKPTTKPATELIRAETNYDCCRKTKILHRVSGDDRGSLKSPVY